MQSDDGIAAWQIFNTIIPLIICCIAIGNLTNELTSASLVLVPALFILIILFLSRSFSLMYDCGHHSLFRSKTANRIAAFLLSIVHAMPHHPWSRGHAFHHKHNGNWNRYRGPSALTTRREYKARNKSSQFLYQFLRHPAILFQGDSTILLSNQEQHYCLASLSSPPTHSRMHVANFQAGKHST